MFSENEKSLKFAPGRKSENRCTGGRPEGERVRVEEGARRMCTVVFFFVLHTVHDHVDGNDMQ